MAVFPNARASLSGSSIVFLGAPPLRLKWKGPFCALGSHFSPSFDAWPLAGLVSCHWYAVANRLKGPTTDLYYTCFL